ncbi:MAG TPA: T9SS type A sorting domain-containing protein, partial [Ignavibacteriaceae bacterium]|nr:T9SS type A sorting domain-containing protein [Ignavibacteriaceae bacterium]
EENNIPEKYALEQNFPNPFNPETNIGYQIAKQGRVTLIIYNLLGEEVKTLVNKDQYPGKYNVTWNGKNNDNLPLSSGIYFYKLQTGNIVLTKKLVLLK